MFSFPIWIFPSMTGSRYLFGSGRVIEPGEAPDLPERDPEFLGFSELPKPKPSPPPEPDPVPPVVESLDAIHRAAATLVPSRDAMLADFEEAERQINRCGIKFGRDSVAIGKDSSLDVNHGDMMDIGYYFWFCGHHGYTGKPISHLSHNTLAACHRQLPALLARLANQAERFAAIPPPSPEVAEAIARFPSPDPKGSADDL